MYTAEKHPKYSFVQILRIPFKNIRKIDFALCNQPTETPDAYYKRQSEKPDIVTNGGFFAMSNGATCMGFKDDGKVIFTDNLPGAAIYGDKKLELTDMTRCGDCRDYIAAYPLLIKDGHAIEIVTGLELDYAARRTCIGWNDDTYFVVIVDSPGLRYRALQEIFLELGATVAINLDGGGSTRLLIDGKRKSAQVFARPVDSVMCVYLDKEPQSKPLYRVQVGAFSSKHNAQALQQKLKDAGFVDSFITKVGMLYKVQLGAFSNKLNADRLRDRLKAAGFNAFVSTSTSEAKP